MRSLVPCLRTALAAALVMAGGAFTPAHAQWMDVATISSTIGNNANRLCMGGGRTDIGCPADAPLLDRSLNRLTVPTDLRVEGNLLVSGSQQFDGVTFANGGVSATGTISATRFNGDGGGITGIDFSANPIDRIVSGTAAVVAQQGGTVGLTLGGTPNAAYFHPTLGFVGPGVSVTGAISATHGYFGGNVGIGVLNPEARLSVNGAVDAEAFVVAPGSNFIYNGNVSMVNLPHYGLKWHTADDNSGLKAALSGYLGIDFFTLGQPRLSVAANGNVGVGKQNPTAKLEVDGTISATNLRLSGNLYVSGSQTIDGVSFANGGVSATGTITATHFVGNGSGLTGIDFSANPIDRIVSGSAAVIAEQAGTVGLTLGGTPNAAYFHPTLGFVGPGVSATGPISGTQGYFSGSVGMGLVPNSANPLTVSGTISATMVNLGTNGSPCTAADRGTIKFENNKMYMCRD